MKNKRVVITGGAGFVGSNLADAIAAENSITIIDDLSTGRIENIKHLIEKYNVTFIQKSILDLAHLEKIFRDMDFVFHLAAIHSVPRSIEEPSYTNSVNITGTLNILIAARDNKVKKLLLASSSSVYGDTSELPMGEEAILKPLSPYAVTKVAGEHYCQVFRQIYELPTVCLRLFNVYGPRQHYTGPYAAVIPAFIGKVLNNQQPIIYGDGNTARDFTYIKDIVSAFVGAADSDSTGVYNIGTSFSITLNELVKAITKITGSNLEPVHIERRAGDIRDSLANISKARQFGYSPKYSIEEGLRETIASIRKELSG
jgi:UDP-glucose 4-epimerase